MVYIDFDILNSIYYWMNPFHIIHVYGQGLRCNMLLLLTMSFISYQSIAFTEYKWLSWIIYMKDKFFKDAYIL